MILSLVAPAPAKKEELRPLVSNNLGDGSEDEDLDFGGLDDNYDDEPLDSQQVFEKSGPLNFKKEDEKECKKLGDSCVDHNFVHILMILIL